MAETRKAIPIDLMQTVVSVEAPPKTSRVIWMTESDWESLTPTQRTGICNFFYRLFHPRSGDWNEYLKETLKADPELAEEYRKLLANDAWSAIDVIKHYADPRRWKLSVCALRRR